MKPTRPPQFNKLLEASIREGLGVLSSSVRDSIILHMRRTARLKLESIDREEFDRYLTKVFGDGATVLKRIILKRLYEETGLPFDEKKDWAFADYVRYAESRWKAPRPK